MELPSERRQRQAAEGQVLYGSSVAKNATAEQIRAMEAMLANDEASSDAELVQHFVREVGVTESEARRWVAKRDQYLVRM